MITYDDLVNDIKSLGIKDGDTLFLRVSYKAIGKSENGPKTFLDALLDVIGENGTLILTIFPKKYPLIFKFFCRNKISSEGNLRESRTGVMPKFALKYPFAMVSKKLTRPFVVIGKHAKYLTENHTNEKEGLWLLREALEKFDSKCLRIGGDSLTGTTHLALDDMLRKYNYYQTCLLVGLYVKENDEVKWQADTGSQFCRRGFRKIYDQLIYPNVSKIEGKIGNGYAIVTKMRDTIEKEREIFYENPKKILCDDPNCVKCRTTFSFSDRSNGKFIINQFIKLKPSIIRISLFRIMTVILNVFWGKKIQ